MYLRTLFIYSVLIGVFSLYANLYAQQDWLAAENQPVVISSNSAIADNVEEIQNLISLAVNGTFEESWNASVQLAALGDVVVPYMIPFLADEREDLHRTKIIVVLKKIGSHAVLPLLQATETKDYFLRQNLCIVLREIRDFRAVGYLRWYTESREGTHSQEVLPYAQQALDAIEGNKKGGNAKQAFYNQGLLYYNQSIVNEALTPHNLWRYVPEKDNVDSVVVPESLYFAALAEETCHRALQIDPNDRSMWALYVAACFKQYIESKNLVARAEEAGVSDETKTAYAEVEKTFAKKRVVGSSAGIDALMAGLSFVMEQNHADVGVEILDSIGDVATEQDLGAGNPVFKALSSQHQMLRYAAARALVQINPKKAFPGSDKVIPSLAEAFNNKEVTALASQALASIDPSRSVFNTSGAVDGLISLLSSDTKEIRLSSIRSLGNIGNAKALPSLAMVLAKGSEEKEIQAASAWAIGEIFKISGTLDPKAYDALIKGVRDSDQEVRNQSGLAMGKASRIEPAKRFSLFLAERQGASSETSEDSNSEDMEESKDSEDMEESKDSEDMEESKDSEDSEDSEDMEESKDSEDSEDSEDF